MIDKSISLIGIVENGEKPVIDGIGNETSVSIEASNVTLKNFDVRRGEIGIEINSNFATIENNSVEYAGRGMVIHSSYNSIKENTVRKSEGIGIFMENPSCHNLLISNLVMQNGGDGTRIDGNNNIALYNNLTKNDGDGILIWYANNCTISFNHAYRNHGNGIDIDECKNITVKNNTLHDNSVAGIQMMDCYHCVVEENEMYRNQGGIMVQSSYGGYKIHKQYNTIRKNNISYNKDVGIYIEYSIMNIFEENNLIHNKMNAWFFYESLIDTDHWQDFPFHPCHNTWYANYWSDWGFHAPKPIKGMVRVFIFIFDRWAFYSQIPHLNFDFHPAMKPYKM